jgi:hypothetical protein
MRAYAQKLILVSAMLASPAVGQADRSRPSIATTDATAARTAYTAEYKITVVRRLANGSTINDKDDTEIRAVDAQGREMSKQKLIRISPHSEGSTISVLDPVAHTRTFWDTFSKFATVQFMGKCSHAQNRAPRRASHLIDHDKPPVEEDLGVDTINGIEAHGTRTTTTLRALPFARVTERWTAVEAGLKGLTVREMTFDPRSGTWTRELTRFKQGAPDPALFSPPSDYEIGEPKLAYDPQSGEWSETFKSLKQGDLILPPTDYEIAPKNPSGDDCRTESAPKDVGPASKEVEPAPKD